MSSLSIVIPTRNRLDYLGCALDSVLSQSTPPTEIIVVDDGSDSAIEAQLEPSLQSRCRWLRNSQSRGVSAARNQGAAAAKGDWLLFLDDDDWLAPGFLAALDVAIESGPADLIWSQKISLRDGEPPPIKLPPTPSSELVGLMDATCSGMAIRRSAFAAVSGFDENLPMTEDRDLVFKLLASAYRAKPAPDAGLYFRIHDGPRLSRDARGQRQALADLKVLHRHLDFLASQPPLAERFMGRVARRLWLQGYRWDALAVCRLQGQIQPRSLRLWRRRLLWRCSVVWRGSQPRLSNGDK